VHRALKTAIAQAEAKLAADEAARAEVEAQARAEAEAKALVEAEEKARLEAEAAENARLEAEAAEQARLEAEAAEKTQREAQSKTRTGEEPFYQAIGTIRGRLSRNEQGHMRLEAYGIDDWFVRVNGRAYKALASAFEAGDPRLDGEINLKCYPIVGREQGGNYFIAGFQVIGFDTNTADDEDGMFTLAGVWQWLSVLRSKGVTYPVLSVYRNQIPYWPNPETDPPLVTHCPVAWRGRRAWSRKLDHPPGWVKIRAKLLCPKRVFEFVELLDECDRAPKRIRAKRSQRPQSTPNPAVQQQPDRDLAIEQSEQGDVVEHEAFREAPLDELSRA
jgi:hypothetical protein